MELIKSETVIHHFYRMIKDDEKKQLSEEQFNQLLLKRFGELEQMLDRAGDT